MFRNRVHKAKFSIPREVVTEVEEKNFDKKGVKYVHFVKKPVISNYPLYTQYQLSSLISAGVPLNPVSPIFDENPSDGDIDKINESLDGYKERLLQKTEEPTEPTE